LRLKWPIKTTTTTTKKRKKEKEMHQVEFLFKDIDEQSERGRREIFYANLKLINIYIKE